MTVLGFGSVAAPVARIDSTREAQRRSTRGARIAGGAAYGKGVGEGGSGSG